MSSLSLKMQTVKAQRVTTTEDSLAVDLSDGRTVSMPLMWYPRLLHGSPRERNNWRLIAGGEGIHWPDLDEDLSVEGIILGRASGESQASLKRWLESRETAARQHRIPRPKSNRQSPRAGRHAARHV
jgi:hypothetical protein